MKSKAFTLDDDERSPRASCHSTSLPNLGRADALALPLRAFLGRLKHHQKFEEWCGTTITLDTSQREIRVALDGEINRIETPLRFSLMPRALRTIVPLDTVVPLAAPASRPAG